LSATSDSETPESDPIRIGLVTDEPIRIAGLTSIFDQPASQAQAQLLPVTGSLPELLSNHSLKYLVVDLLSFEGGLNSLETIRRARPGIRLIVIGPALDDETVLRSIVAGARAYVGVHEGPEMVRKAIEVVLEGSIWAPRRLLSKLIDRLLEQPQSSRAPATPQLTTREHQVLQLIMKARSNREIAARLGIEERTVRAHLARLMRKAGVDNRIKLVMAAPNLLELPPRATGRNAALGRVRRGMTN